jgi:hypothetical protein
MELVTDPTVFLLHPLGQYFMSAEIGSEFSLGLLFLSGFYWRYILWFGLVLFAAFGANSLYLALHGAASCGCFGSLHVNPWWTFALDATVVLGFFASTRLDSVQMRNHLRSGAYLRTGLRSGRHLLIVGVTGLAAVIGVALFRYADQHAAAASSILAAPADLFLEPEKWIGQKLPIADAIDVDLSHGEWIVLLHRHDCPICHQEVPKYEQRADAGEHIALIEVPPYGNSERHGNRCLHGRLRETHEWFVQTPVEVRLNDGVVTAVNTNEQ